LKETSIYIHIPFCDHKCIYCDFYSIINHENISKYISALKKEIEYYSKLYSQNRIINTIFFGGGTPSLMEPDYIGEIINFVKQNFNVEKKSEITLETNPGTVDKYKLEKFLQNEINRISIGIQSFDEDDLKFLTRIHDKKTAIETVKNAAQVGFENINIDLIFNLPKQTKKKWIYNLQSAVELPVKHISAYSLILERGTILNKLVLDGKVEIQDEDYDAELYEITIDFLEENNFRQYEVSNFAKENFECRHNKAYWNYKDYISFGTSAHSFVEGKRWWNLSSLNLYLAKVEQTSNAVANFENLSKEQMLEEYIMLALRSSGINLNEFKNKFGINWIDERKNLLNIFESEGLLIQNKNLIRLTKKGYAVCDEIINKLL